MNRIRGRWKRLSILRKLYFVVGTMGVLIACELIVLRVSMEQVSAVRAFVEGEALWSKSQKDALLELKKFQRTRDEQSYQAFLEYLKVPEGDHRARLELIKPEPDLSVVRAGFLQGRIHPDDVDRMVFLLRRFHWLSYVSQAIADWTAADGLLQELLDTAARFHDVIRAHEDEKAAILLDRINDLNARLTPIEDHFSSVLGEGSRWLESRVLSLFSLMVILVEATGLTLTVLTGREIAAIATENGRLYRKATESIKTRDEFLSIASHELKTPLAALSLQLQLIQHKVSRLGANAEGDGLFSLSGQSLAATQRLNTLLDELLDLTRIRAGHLELQRKPCNLTGIVQDAVTLLGAEAAKCGSRISIQASGAVLGSFDSNRISQVVINLLSNAIKYGDGKPIEVTVESRGTLALVRVKDHGKGIPAEKIPKLFQRFERFEHDPSIPGLGLGLFISSEIAKAHQGRITAESDSGRGSAFTLEIEC